MYFLKYKKSLYILTWVRAYVQRVPPHTRSRFAARHPDGTLPRFAHSDTKPSYIQSHCVKCPVLVDKLYYSSLVFFGIYQDRHEAQEKTHQKQAECFVSLALARWRVRRHRERESKSVRARNFQWRETRFRVLLFFSPFLFAPFFLAGKFARKANLRF